MKRRYIPVRRYGICKAIFYNKNKPNRVVYLSSSDDEEDLESSPKIIKLNSSTLEGDIKGLPGLFTSEGDIEGKSSKYEGDIGGKSKLSTSKADIEGESKLSTSEADIEVKFKLSIDCENQKNDKRKKRCYCQRRNIF